MSDNIVDNVENDYNELNKTINKNYLLRVFQKVF